jgi:hypothetical protein
MNDQLQSFAREELKKGLALLPESWQDKFKLMYGREDTKLRSEEDIREIKAIPINEVVDSMSEDKLDWAMQQVNNSIKKIGIKP